MFNYRSFSSIFSELLIFFLKVFSLWFSELKRRCLRQKSSEFVFTEIAQGLSFHTSSGAHWSQGSNILTLCFFPMIPKIALCWKFMDIEEFDKIECRLCRQRSKSSMTFHCGGSVREKVKQSIDVFQITRWTYHMKKTNLKISDKTKKSQFVLKP